MGEKPMTKTNDEILEDDDELLDSDYEPTDYEMMQSFGTKWHDGL